MLSTAEAQSLLDNGQVVDNDGKKIGKVGQVFLDDESGQPAWVTVKTGWFGTGESFVPLDQARVDGDDVVVPYASDQIKDAPRVDDSDGRLKPHEEDDLYRHYNLDHSAPKPSGDVVRESDTNPPVAQRDGDTNPPVADRDSDARADSNLAAGHDTSGPETDDAMTRSEERLHVGKTSETTGRARLRKFIVTENVTQTVPVSHEEVEVVREPITDANRDDAVAGGDLSEEEHQVELQGERVVVDKDTVPVERVQLGKRTVTEDETVDEQVRKEQIEASGEGAGGQVARGSDDEGRGPGRSDDHVR